MDDQAPVRSAPAPVSVTIDPAIQALLVKLWSLVAAFLGWGAMGATSGYVTGHILKQGIAENIPQVPPILKRLLPPTQKAEEAIGKISFGNSGCTATVIGPVWSDDERIDILTAAHCVKVGAVGKMKLRDGREFAVRCVSRDPGSDAAWLQAEKPAGSVPHLLLAEALPANGSPIYHAGFGVHIPGNREIGSFKGYDAKREQCIFALNVSPGDSGGGICLDADNRVLSPVCCTTSLARFGTVWGASPAAAAKCRPGPAAEVDAAERFYPVLPLPPELRGPNS